MKALILTDGKAGHENQSKALARALGFEFDLVPVKFAFPGAKALSYLFDNLGIRSSSLFRLAEPAEKPAVVIGTGSGTFYAAKTLAKKLGVKCAVVLYPRGYSLKSFDCVLAPKFDNPPPAPNVVTIPANLVANDEEFYKKGEEEFLKRHTPSGRGAVAVIIGGPNKCSTMTEEWMKGELDRIFAVSGDAEKWVTTSRRTPPGVEKLVDGYPWDYRLIYSREKFNPIPAFVKLASRLYVTAESTGMLSEACTCGSAEVYALDNLLPGPHKFRRFVENLGEGGYTGGNRKIDLSAEISMARSLLGL